MDKQEIILDYISNEIMKGRGDKLTAEDDLLSSGILDSLGILQLVAFIDERFDMQVPDEGVVYENFHSVQALVNYLDQLEA